MTANTGVTTATGTGGRGAGELARAAHAVLVATSAGTLVPPDWLLRRLDAGLGGVCLFGRNIVDAAQVRGFTDALRAARPDVVVATDEEGGDVTRLHRAAGSPHLGHLALGAVDDPDVTRRTAAAIGTELAAAGIDWDFAPVADVNAEPDSPVIGVRSFGADPAAVSRHVAAYTAGLADAGIAACVKHFPGHGATSADSHTDLPRIRLSRADLDAVHLPPFRAAADAGAESVMLGHLLVDCLDARLPASLSPAAVRLLREEVGFDGVIVTDALEMRAVADGWTIPGAAVLAVAAGADALCLSGYLHDEDVVDACVRALVDAVREGRLPGDRLLEAGGRMARFGAGRAAARSAITDGRDRDDVLRRSLLVRGEPRLAPGPIDLVAYLPEPSIAAGVSAWDPAAALAALRPGTTLHRAVRPERDEPVLLAELPVPNRPERDRPLVALVRDAHRHAWIRADLARLLRDRPDAVVVELGVPVTDPGGRAWITAYGSGAASVLAVARVLGLA